MGPSPIDQCPDLAGLQQGLPLGRWLTRKPAQVFQAFQTGWMVHLHD
jgi:hypothetical protein